MSSSPTVLQQPRPLSSSSASSSDSGTAPRSTRSPPSYANTMDRRHGRVYPPSSAQSPTQELNNAGDSSGGHNTGDGGARYPPRTHSHGAVASHFLAQPPSMYGGQTWMDFLRESGAGTDPNNNAYPTAPLPNQNHNQNPLPPLPPDSFASQASSSNARFTLPTRPPHPSDSSSRSSGDRKRRLTTAESPLRRPSNTRVRSGTANTVTGASSQDPIVLGSSPIPTPMRPPPPPQFLSQSSMATLGHGASGEARRGSELVLPRWQPDSEASHCFVCRSQFTWLYRKHHCRKCGRVVCSACSPHRITIPRQFIVHSPSEIPNIIDLTVDDDDNAMSTFGPFRNPALGGGEEVRVCNPCVPDPNYSLPPPYTPGSASPFSSQFSPLSPQLQNQASLPRLHPRGHRASQSVHDNAQAGGQRQSIMSRDPFTDRRVSYHGSTRVADLWPPTQAPHQSQHSQQQQSIPGHVQPSVYDHRAIAHSRPNPSTSASTPVLPQNVAGMHPIPNAFPRSFFSHGPPEVRPTQPQPAPRRQIAEEDECPICGNELPPKGPNGDDQTRIQHVQDCIMLHSSSPPPHPAPAATTDQISTSLPSQRTRGMSSAANATGNGEGASSNRTSISARGMYPYVASEKDCVDDDGEPAECVICFEEFEAGDRMARLVCWCKFHEKCIKQWWEKKGRGACPTHQVGL